MSYLLCLTTDNPQNSCEQYDAFVVILSLRLLHLQDSGYYCKLFDVHARVTLSKMHLSGYYTYKISYLWLSYAISKNITTVPSVCNHGNHGG